MGLQLIFCLETNNSNQSDWIYVKQTLNHYYESNVDCKYSHIFMDSKTKYNSKSVERNIRSLVNQYKAASRDNLSQVIYIVDTDNYDSDPQDANLYNEITDYCKKHGYRTVWCCKDIERVYLDKKVADKEKKEAAVKFKRKEMIKNLDISRLSSSRIINNTCNILCVLDDYLKRRTN